jgi:predicted RNA-binding Zn-ribbon protein involved in translation (DUF1610 family)
MAASAPDGAPLSSCAGAWFSQVPDALQVEYDLTDGEWAFWGALPPAITVGEVAIEPGAVHVHHRPSATVGKDIDASFDIVEVRNTSARLTIEGLAARAFSISTLSGQVTVPLACPRCGEVHIDELKFATRGHRKHQCNSCGRDFWHQTSTISNPLAAAHAVLGLPEPPAPRRVDRPLDLDTSDYTAVALWPSNTAFINTMTRPEESGIHVHAWVGARLDLDDTYAPVVLDGELIDEEVLRALVVQRSLAAGAPVVALACSSCGNQLLSPADGWVEPTTTHICASCSATTKTRRKSFVNPLAEK